MRVIFWIAIMLLSNNVKLNSQSTTDFFQRTNNILEQYVSDGKVSYDLIIKDEAFKQLIEEIGSTEFNSISEESRKAYLINVYNLMVIDGVGQIYPTSSVQKTIGFFDRIKRRILNQEMTLNDFEKEIEN